MLQRAASNAYSWWWASHIRIRQSKWLEQNLRDMDDKVKYILRIIDEDADSFAKRAEMYYRKRPELLNFVEETYRAYRALAERYDHISGELQNANNTIATVFPGQVHFGIEEEDEEEGTPERKLPTAAAATKIPKNVPDISKLTLKLPKSIKKFDMPSKKVETKKTMGSNPCKEEEPEEIDKLQKGILILQTEKEFMKSSYETALAKFWEIEKQIIERQKKVCHLQDEHSVETVIEDDEARALMAATALKSCEDTLAQLQEQHMKSTEAASIESKRIMGAEEKLRSLKCEALLPEVNHDNNTCEARVSNSCSKDLEEDVKILNEGRMELESICQKVKQYLEMKSDDSFSVTVLAEMIDELVNKVLTLGTAVSSQTALLERLRTETDELQRHLQALEEEKASVVYDSNSLTEKIKEMEEDLHEIHNLSHSVEDQNNQIRNHFNEACRDLDDLSEKLHSPKAKDTIETLPLEEETQEITLISHDELLGPQTELNGQLVEAVNKSVQEDAPASSKTLEEAADKPSDVSLPDEEVQVHVKENLVEEAPRELEHKKGTVQEKVPSNTAEKLGIGPNVEVSNAVDDSLWQQLLLNGLDDREKILLTAYTTILRSYKDTNKRLSEVEKKNQETMFQTMAQVRELKSSNAMKDLEIRSLKQKLGVLNTFSDENSDTQLIEIRKSHPNRLRSKLQISRSAVSNFLSNTPSHIDESVQNAQLNGKSEKVEEATPDQDEIMVDLVNEPNMDITVEEKFRRDIDELLEVNLDFWLRFSHSFHQIQKFHAAIQEHKSHISKIKESKTQAGSSSRSAHPSPQLEVSGIDKSLRELQSQLSDWLDQSALHREELQCRLLSLSRMQDEIARVLDMGSDLDQAEFTAYQAEKFQGEVLNIQQENTTVHEELQAGVDYVRSLHAEIEKILSKLNEKFNESSPRNSHHHHHHHHHFHHLQSVKHSMSRTKIPLRSFLFGAKPKKSKQSLLACMTPSLQLQKQHSDMNAARKFPL